MQALLLRCTRIPGCAPNHRPHTMPPASCANPFAQQTFIYDRTCDMLSARDRARVHSVMRKGARRRGEKNVGGMGAFGSNSAIAMASGKLPGVFAGAVLAALLGYALWLLARPLVRDRDRDLKRV